MLWWFAERADVYVSGDLLIYYQEGDPGASIAPDVFVVMGAAKHERPSYRLWDEPKAPDFVLVSDVLGLALRARAGRQMRFHDPAMGRDLLSHREEHARAEREAAARQAAEARVAELEGLIRDRRG